MNEFIGVWSNSEPYHRMWLRVRVSSVVAVHERRAKLSSEARPITFVIGEHVLEGSVQSSEPQRVGLPVPELAE
jgi:hypothetical protein